MLFRKGNSADIEKCRKALHKLTDELRKLSGPGGAIEKYLTLTQSTGKQPEKGDIKLFERVKQLRNDNKALIQDNEALKDEIKESEEKYKPYYKKIEKIESLFFPDFLNSPREESMQELKSLLIGYYTDQDNDPLLGLLLGQILTINASKEKPEHLVALREAVREWGRLLVKILEKREFEPDEICKTLKTVAQDINPHFKGSKLQVRVPSINSIPDSAWMVYPPGSGKVSSIRSWCVSDAIGTTIFHAEVEC